MCVYRNVSSLNLAPHSSWHLLMLDGEKKSFNKFLLTARENGLSNVFFVRLVLMNVLGVFGFAVD